MDIQFYGANCLILSNKQNRIVIDDNLTSLGAKSVTKDGDICLFSDVEHPVVSAKPKLIIDIPGEYEVGNISIFGLQARSHMDEESVESAVIYKITWGDTRVVTIGHAFPRLSDDQLETIGLVDVMFVPVGGNGYTLDATGALQLIKAVEPKIVVPTHYDDPHLHYQVPQSSLDDVLKTLGMEQKDKLTKFQFRPGDTSDTAQLVVLEAVR